MTLQAHTDTGAQLSEINSETHHVPLLVHYPPKIAVSRLVINLKGVSTCLLRQEYRARLSKHRWDGRLWPRPTSPPPVAGHL
ncbi:hypothetical protein GCM10029978_030020 [Actinoallomurus acanthiterrae]